MKSRTRLLWCLAVAVVILRLIAALNFEPVVAIDSVRYRQPENPLLPFYVWRGAGPGVLVQFLFLLPEMWGITAQILLSGLLWSTAAMLVYAADHGRGVGVAGCVLLLGTSLHPWSSLWDLWFLTEAVTTAASVATLVGAAVLVAGDASVRRAALAVCLVGLACAVAARPFVLPFLVPIVVLAALLSGLSRQGSPKRHLMITGSVLVSTIAFGTWHIYEFESQEFLVGIRAAERLAIRGVNDGYMEAAREHGMPSCSGIEQVFAGPSDQDARFETAIREMTAPTCPEFETWLRSGGLPWTAELVANPGTTLRDFADPEDWVGMSIVQYASRDPRSSLLAQQGDVDQLLRRLNFLTYLLWCAAAIGAIMATVRARRWKSLSFVLAVTAWSVVFVYANWASTAIENFRHGLPAIMALGPFGLAIAVSRGNAASSRPSATTPEDLW